VEFIFKFMNPNFSQALTVPGTDEIREILVKRVDQQKQAVGIVAGIIEPNGPRVVAYGNLARGDPRTVDGDRSSKLYPSPRSSPPWHWRTW
jgi:hypothetical protein